MVAFVDDAVDALAVGGPEVVVVGLFGVEADRVEKLEGEGAEEDVDVGEVFGSIVRLFAVAEVTCHPSAKLD